MIFLPEGYDLAPTQPKVPDNYMMPGGPPEDSFLRVVNIKTGKEMSLEEMWAEYDNNNK